MPLEERLHNGKNIGFRLIKQFLIKKKMFIKVEIRSINLIFAFEFILFQMLLHVAIILTILLIIGVLWLMQPYKNWKRNFDSRQY